MLPTLDGDFNGDGYADALYARDRRQLSFLLQKPNAGGIFPSSPSGTYDVTVPRLIQIGDLTGDGKSDVVLFDRRASGNQKFTVLLNAGRL
ncbi:MAG TPA: VCBS repeat-containing protein [Bdellovibrionota bacterium]|nr:VCBS repeat-containing protein [Bdellovibrionota bacterium]